MKDTEQQQFGGHPFATLRRMVERASDLTERHRERAELARDYYSGDQLSEAQKAEYKRRKMIPVVDNRVIRKVDAMIGIEQNGRTDPRAFARGPEDEKAADLVTKALVFVDDQTRFDSKRSAAFENLIIEGYGGVEVVVEERRGKLEVAVNKLRWEEIFYDPASREKDFSDAAYLGVMKWMSLDQALELYEGDYTGDQPLEDLLQATMSGVGQTFEDRPQGDFSWSDRSQERVRVVQMYYRRRGVWFLSIFTGGGEIWHGESPYQDEDGKTVCPLVLMTAYIDRKNRRFGVVESLISLQDEINSRRARLIQLAHNRQTAGLKGAVSVAAMKAEMAKPDGHVEVDPEVAEAAGQIGMRPFEVLQNGDQVAAQFQLLAESKQEIDQLGPNASLLGQVEGQQSGRAIMAQQQAGMAELAPLYDSLRDWTLRVYRAMWNRIKQFWTDERWIRVTEDMEAPQFIGVNQFQGWQVDPMGQLVPMVENQLAEMDVDIVIEDAPDFITLRHEQFEQLTQMAQAGVPIPPEMMIESSSLRDKQRLIEMMREQNQAAQQAQTQAMQAEEERKTIDTQSQAQLRGAQAAKAVSDAQKNAFEIQQAQTSTAIGLALGMPAVGA